VKWVRIILVAAAAGWACVSLVRSGLLLPVALAQGTPQIAGTWRGHSVCAVAKSACRDEVNVYRFSEIAAKPNHFLCTGTKILDGKEIVMGSGEWTYDASKHVLQTVTSNPRIGLILDLDNLEGALSLPDGTIYRRIRLKKNRE
jgi:hypothetical protein